MVSVRLGARETMRRTGCGMWTVRPVSSVKSLKAETAGADVLWVRADARSGIAHSGRAAHAASAARCNRARWQAFKNTPKARFFRKHRPKKTPHEMRWGC